MLTDASIDSLISTLRKNGCDKVIFDQKFGVLVEKCGNPIKKYAKSKIKQFAFTLNAAEIEAEAEKITVEIWKRLKKDILIPCDKGGYDSAKNYTFAGWLTKRYQDIFVFTDPMVYALVQEMRSETYDNWHQLLEILKPRLKESILKHFDKISEEDLEKWLNGGLSDKIKEKLTEKAYEGGYDFEQEHKKKKRDIVSFLVDELFGIEKSFDRESPVVFGEDEGDVREPADNKSPERVVTDYVTYRMLFKLICRCGGYPHEQLSFLFSKFIYGQPVEENKGEGERQERAFEGQPKEFAEKYDEIELAGILHELKNVIVQTLEQDDLTVFLDPVDIRLKCENIVLMGKKEKEEKEKNEEKNKETEQEKTNRKLLNSVLAAQKAANSFLMDYVEDYASKKAVITELERDYYRKKLVKYIAERWCGNVTRSIYAVLQIKRLAGEAIDKLKKQGGSGSIVGHPSFKKQEIKDIIEASYRRAIDSAIKKIEQKAGKDKVESGFFNRLGIKEKEMKEIVESLLSEIETGVKSPNHFMVENAEQAHRIKHLAEKTIKIIMHVLSDEIRRNITDYLSNDTNITYGFSKHCSPNSCKLSHVKPCGEN